MLEKKVIVYLDTGATMEQVLEVKDASDYLEKIADYMKTWTGEPRDALVFLTPLRFYRVQNIVALELLEPPPQSDKLPLGFIKSR